MKMLNQVLLIDDSFEDNEFHEIEIQKCEIAKQVKSFTDGPAALDYVKDCIETAKPIPDLIFLDIHMPRRDGFEWLNDLKQLFADNPDTERKTKVIILSGNSDPVMEIYLNSPNYDDLMVGYRSKPLTTEMLTEIVEKYF